MVSGEVVILNELDAMISISEELFSNCIAEDNCPCRVPVSPKEIVIIREELMIYWPDGNDFDVLGRLRQERGDNRMNGG